MSVMTPQEIVHELDNLPAARANCVAGSRFAQRNVTPATQAQGALAS
jgi:hypothetical protein